MARDKKNLSILIIFFVLGCSSKGWLKPALKEAPALSQQTPVKKKKKKSLVFNSDGVKLGDEIDTTPTRKKKKNYLFRRTEVIDKKTGKKTSRREQTKKPPKSRKERRKYAVSYSGNQAIRQKKSHSYTGQVETVMTLRGNAAIKHRHTSIYAPLIEVIGENAGVAIAPSRIKLVDHKEGTILTAGYGEYIKFERRALVRNNPKVVHVNKKSGSKTTITSDEMERFIAKAQTICHGNVVIEGQNYLAFGDKAIYFENEDVIHLEGDAKIFQTDNIYLADEMKFYNNRDRATLRGNVKLILTERKNAPAKSKTAQELNEEASDKEEKDDLKTVTTVVSSEECLYEFGKAIKHGRKATFYSTKKRRVRIDRTDSITYAGNLQVWGEGPTEILALDDVQVLYKADNSQIYSEYVHHHRLENIVRLKTEKSNSQKKEIRPRIIFYDEQGLPSGALSAETIDRNLLLTKTQARGKVQIDMFRDTEKKEPPVFGKLNSYEDFNYDKESSIHGEYAEIFQDSKVAYVLGNPYVMRESSKLFGRKIILYPDERRFEILGSIHGQMRN